MGRQVGRYTALFSEQHFHRTIWSLFALEVAREGQEIYCVACQWSHLVREQITELDALDGKVDNGRILLHKESVLGEPLDIQDDEPSRGNIKGMITLNRKDLNVLTKMYKYYT